MDDKKIELTLGLVNAVLQYLGTRPYTEVAQLIAEIHTQGASQVPAPEPEPVEEPLVVEEVN